LDPDGDGHSNFLEFATGKSPTGANSAPASLVEASPEGLIFDYDRSKLAHQSGYSFHVEWNDSLTGLWQTTGVTQSLHADQGSVETIRAVIPAPTGGKRFVRLRVNAPQ
jgi:hypothetical protein